MTRKSRLKSKTNWAAIIIAVIGVIEANMHVIPAEYHGYVLVLIAIIMAVLREFTRRPVRD